MSTGAGNKASTKVQLNLFKHILEDLEGLAASDGPQAQDVFAAFGLHKAWVQPQPPAQDPASSSGGALSTIMGRRRATFGIDETL